jgi:hypothetical protein
LFFHSERLKSDSVNRYTDRRVDDYGGGVDDETNTILDTIGL